jgi:hypothetical protein
MKQELANTLDGISMDKFKLIGSRQLSQPEIDRLIEQLKSTKK